MQIARHRQFEKKLLRLPKSVRDAVADRTGLFIMDPHNPLLRDHGLAGNRRGQRSFNITGDWRLVYEPVGSDTVLFLDIATHHDLYGT